MIGSVIENVIGNVIGNMIENDIRNDIRNVMGNVMRNCSPVTKNVPLCDIIINIFKEINHGFCTPSHTYRVQSFRRLE